MNKFFLDSNIIVENKKSEKARKERLRNLLLNGPIVNKKDMEEIENIKKWYKEWKVQ
ncbi:MAG: hypothetical protein ABRQ38_26185 [Candidatus Eremiobacterota bacterium]